MTEAEPRLEDRQSGPTVNISSPKAVIRGRSTPFTNVGAGTFTALESFKQIPYAKPPVGALRLKPPVALDPSLDLGTIDATTAAAPACPQQIKGKPLPHLNTEFPRG